MTRKTLGELFAIMSVIVFSAPREAASITLRIDTIGGTIEAEVSHCRATTDLVAPQALPRSRFRPPSIFSAPLPSGSGARALAVAGAFTAIADDATAASWNPAGLIQLERPEASWVLRFSRQEDVYHSSAESFRVKDSEYDSWGVNYVSLVLPFSFRKRNLVFSLNFQEAYDFRQSFSAQLDSTTDERYEDRASSAHKEIRTQHLHQGIVEVDLTTEVHTEHSSFLQQVIRSATTADIDFQQRGLITAVSPALCMEVTPKLSLGLTINFYRIGCSGEDEIRSKTRAAYSGKISNHSEITDRLVSTGTYHYVGTVDFGPPYPPVPISGGGSIPRFEDESHEQKDSSAWVDGIVEEECVFRDLNGVNATIGVLWTVSRKLRLGATIDLPWTADAEQSKRLTHKYAFQSPDRKKTILSGTLEDYSTENVRLRFPLFWAVGGVWHWNDHWYTSLDVSCTHWSDFAYKAGESEWMNPLDGTSQGQHPIDDCWAVRLGNEYLILLPRTEIALRAGVAWEQRPDLQHPDEYWILSLGSGISLGRDPGKMIIDISYAFSRGEDVGRSLVPSHGGVETDVEKHEIYLSSIWHF